MGLNVYDGDESYMPTNEIRKPVRARKTLYEKDGYLVDYDFFSNLLFVTKGRDYIGNIHITDVIQEVIKRSQKP